MGGRERARNRVRERLDELADAPLARDDACLDAIEILRTAVGFDRWCWPRTDPASALATSGIAEFDLWAEVPRMAALEEHGDVTSKPQLVASARACEALSAATSGDLARSRRWRECLAPHGVGDEIMTVCRDRHGCWGTLELMRDDSDRFFDADDMALLDDLAPTLGRMLRRTAAEPAPTATSAAPLAPATLILDAELRPTSWTASYHDWLSELGLLPPAAFELGARVLRPPEQAAALPAVVRLRAPGGRWVTLEGAQLEGGAASGNVAITMREASAAEVFDLLCMTYDLTRRERQLVGLVLDGLATKQLALAMGISPHTVQDHLKAVFAKTGARSRRELGAQLAGRRAG
jgi:DNA-binding CsgD family transcriptional regulator